MTRSGFVHAAIRGLLFGALLTVVGFDISDWRWWTLMLGHSAVSLIRPTTPGTSE